MKTLSDFLSCLLLLGLGITLALFLLMMVLGLVGFVTNVLWVVFYPLYCITLKPVVWFGVKAFQSRCPKCKGFWKRRFVKNEVVEQKEVLETVERIDEGVIYSNSLFAANHGYEVKRLEQVRMVQETIARHWVCKDTICGYQWTTEEYSEYEGALDK